MSEVKSLIHDVQDNKMEIANLRLDQILKDKIAVAIDQQRVEVANKVFNSES
jgi:hypothetical protein